MKVEKKFKTIKAKVTIPAPPEMLYDAFVNAKTHSAFTGSKATSNPKVGGKFTAWDGYIFGKNLELEKGKKIVQEWTTTEWPADYPPSRLQLTFKKVKEGTELTMVQSGVPAAQASELDEGWNEFYWIPLKNYFTKKTSSNIKS